MLKWVCCHSVYYTMEKQSDTFSQRQPLQIMIRNYWHLVPRCHSSIRLNLYPVQWKWEEVSCVKGTEHPIVMDWGSVIMGLIHYSNVIMGAMASQSRNHDRMHVFPTRTFGARNVLRHRLPELVHQFPADLIRKAKTHSITAFSNQVKHHILESYSYDCFELNCYVCNNIAS